MITFSDFLLNKIIFEVRFKKGYKYWDKCGDTLLKIEEEDKEWVWQKIGNDGASVINSKNKMTMLFSWDKIWVEQKRAENLNQMKKTCDLVSKIILNNLDISEISRIGNRFWYFLPFESVEKAETFISKSELLVPDAKKIAGFGKNVINRDFTLVMEQDGINCRIAIGAIARPKHDKLDADKEYVKFNPPNAVLVDIDIFTNKPIKASGFMPSDFIQKAHKKIEGNLLSLFK